MERRELPHPAGTTPNVTKRARLVILPKNHISHVKFKLVGNQQISRKQINFDILKKYCPSLLIFVEHETSHEVKFKVLNIIMKTNESEQVVGIKMEEPSV